MTLEIMKKIFGTRSSREIKRIMPLVENTEALSDKYRHMSESELKGQTAILKARLEKGETLDDILPEAYATVREASHRVLGMYHYRVQLIGGIVLHQGRIAEMKTGEGKTLVATLPSYLNALTGNGVHIVTVNDYLAARDSEWMGKVHRYLGLSVGLIVHSLTSEQRRAAYNCDITYGTNNELGFDYLRDNMAIYKQDMTQRGFTFAIVDEVDSILIDEARTPLIISGAGDKSTDLYETCDRFASRLRSVRVREMNEKEDEDDKYDGDYVVDEKARTVTLTPSGIKKAETSFNIDNITDPAHTTLLHHINQAIRARGIMQRDVDYVVKDGQIIIVDEFTGRLMLGRRYSDGLHQAIEAKEHVKVERESKTLATITFQNFFRLYKKLSGMTGTAMTEEEEFGQIYKLDVIEIPTNLPMIRDDFADAVYKNEVGKFRAVINDIEERHAKGQPVLVGTISIEKSELLSSLLKKRNISHVVLNAKYHEKEAEIVAQAGRLGAVTIATNMAGRGTDIRLGGNPEYMALSNFRTRGLPEELISELNSFAETDDLQILQNRIEFNELHEAHKKETSEEAKKVVEAGGLCIIGTERHESRRIDNQLRGRSARQGDPGVSRFYISLEDDLMRLFGSERIYSMLEGLGLDDDTPIDHKLLSGAIESAQKRIESRNFQTRKHVLDYDDVMNTQRGIIYDQRGKVLNGENLTGYVEKTLSDFVKNGVESIIGEGNIVDTWQVDELRTRFTGLFITQNDLRYTREELNNVVKQDIINILLEKAKAAYAAKETEVGSDRMRELERFVLLQMVDRKWMDHIDAMQELRQGITLRAYGQYDPLVEYKRESAEIFHDMIMSINEDTIRLLLSVKLRSDEDIKREQVAKPSVESHGGDGSEPARQRTIVKGKKIGRNDPCPCGSGKKYKKCCGA